ncbi:MAG TPA: 30S ribosome-binding factor RbfA [Alphaproteobacteria bacterium]|nr:30S ribosome-binding factor RbfA [Pseudomonadota bacterium]HIM45492.1 30S ribosome-binding factor RbfA [Alphaproteobacteria bacterium]
MARGNAPKSRAPSQRQLRVGELLREALTDTFQRAPIRDPILSGVAITVTEVRTAPDLKQARVFVMPLGGGDGAPIVEALGRAAPYLRTEVARRVNLRYAPALEFELDRSFDESSHIDELLNELPARNE